MTDDDQQDQPATEDDSSEAEVIEGAEALPDHVPDGTIDDEATDEG